MATTHHRVANYSVHSIPLTRPFIWLREGWVDLSHHRSSSLAYGLLVSVLGSLILAYDRHPFYIAAMIAGFLLVGPIMTAGLCELSRCQDRGETADFQSSLLPLQRNRSSLLGFAERLALISAIWFALSGAIFFSLVGSVAPSLDSTMWGGVMQQLTSSQLSAYYIVGFVLSAIVFALSVVTVPMIVDRHVDAGTAMRTSLRVTMATLPAMLVWATLIAALVLFGFATNLLAMVVIFPLLGHATWRAYSELVEQ
jgi:uncharacterized membrane protein